MNRGDAQRLLGLLAILLTIIIGYELTVGNPNEINMIAANTLNATDAGTAGAVVAVPPEQTAQWVSVALARPLFSPKRRPDLVPQAQQAAEDGPVDLPRLAGILLNANSKHAVFQPTGDKKPIILSEGGEIAGWTVQKIDATEVTLSGPSGTTKLEPKFDENLVPPAAQQPGLLPGGRNGFAPPRLVPPIVGAGRPAVPAPGTPSAIPGVPAGRFPPRNQPGQAGPVSNLPAQQAPQQPTITPPRGSVPGGGQ